MADQGIVYSVGHSTHSLEHFLSLLRTHGITAVCDVRSKPYSRLNPQYNREMLKNVLQEGDIAYVFLGAELGARSEDLACFEGGRVRYELVVRTALFRAGLDRVREGMKHFRVALMCAEKDAADCHRTILVARHLENLGLEIRHIDAEGGWESQAAVMQRVLLALKLPEKDLFHSRAEMLANAYEIQGERICYVLEEPRAASA
jgi:uncharacterized protein (DUF488 family)